MRRVASLLVIFALVGTSGFSCLSAAVEPHCCTPDPAPECCMVFGGWSGVGGGCEKLCDGMPLPGDPGWKLETDSHGCSRWTNPAGSSAAHPYCGGIYSTDAGPDATDAKAD